MNLAIAHRLQPELDYPTGTGYGFYNSGFGMKEPELSQSNYNVEWKNMLTMT